MTKTFRFYCRECGKEMWELADWNAICYLTLKQAKELLICSDCLLEEIHTNMEEDNG